MARFGRKTRLALPGGNYRNEHVFRGKAALVQKECVDRLSELSAWCRRRFPDLKSAKLLLSDEHHRKWLVDSSDSEIPNSIRRAHCYVTFAATGADGAPVELPETMSVTVSLADLDVSVDALAPMLERVRHGAQRPAIEFVQRHRRLDR